VCITLLILVGLLFPLGVLALILVIIIKTVGYEMITLTAFEAGALPLDFP
jgi:hypothetical protein